MKCPKCAGELREENELLVCDSCGATYPKGGEKPAEDKESAEVRPAAQKSEEQLRIEMLERRLAEMEAKQTAGKASPVSSAIEKMKKFFQSIPSFIRSHKKAAAFSAFGLLAVILIIVLCTSLCGVRGVYVNKANAEDYYVFSAGSYTTVSNLGGEDMEEKGKWKASGGKITFTVKDEMFGKISESFDFKKSKDNDLIEIDGKQYERVARSIKSKAKITLDANGGEGGIHKKIRIGSKIEVKEPTREGFVFLGWANSEGEFFNDYERIWKSASYKAKWRCVEHPESAIRERVLKEATCVSDGLRGRVCSVCECVVSSEIIPATGVHSGDWETVVAATCTEDGEKQRTCAVCGAIETSVIPMAHTFGDWETVVEATCTESGLKQRFCLICEIKEEKEISSLGHDFTEWEITIAPKCSTTGESQRICSRCGNLESEIIPATGHYYDVHTKKCVGCDQTVSSFEKNSMIAFGEYPQSIKAKNVSITDTTDSRGYYLGSDGEYYAKVTADPYEKNYTFSSCASVKDGAVYYFKVEPIKWRILSKTNGEALILCDSIIDSQEYYPSTNSNTFRHNGGTGYANNYALSNVRKWLNDAFYNKAFTDLEKELIVITKIDNSNRSSFETAGDWADVVNKYSCSNTRDNIFFLSMQEVTTSGYGFSSYGNRVNLNRQKQTSDYSRAVGAYMSTSSYFGNGVWWLRSPSDSVSDRARSVRNDGYASRSDVSNSGGGVVPALKIKLD